LRDLLVCERWSRDFPIRENRENGVTTCEDGFHFWLSGPVHWPLCTV
jgi:hypothetical protein